MAIAITEIYATWNIWCTTVAFISGSLQLRLIFQSEWQWL
jgi:hypothetical protein